MIGQKLQFVAFWESKILLKLIPLLNWQGQAFHLQSGQIFTNLSILSTHKRYKSDTMIQPPSLALLLNICDQYIVIKTACDNYSYMICNLPIKLPLFCVCFWCLRLVSN